MSSEKASKRRRQLFVGDVGVGRNYSQHLLGKTSHISNYYQINLVTPLCAGTLLRVRLALPWRIFHGTV